MKYTSTNIDIKQIPRKEKRGYTIKDVFFDTSRYTKTRPRLIKRIPLEFHTK